MAWSLSALVVGAIHLTPKFGSAVCARCANCSFDMAAGTPALKRARNECQSAMKAVEVGKPGGKTRDISKNSD